MSAQKCLVTVKKISLWFQVHVVPCDFAVCAVEGRQGCLAGLAAGRGHLCMHQRDVPSADRLWAP